MGKTSKRAIQKSASKTFLKKGSLAAKTFASQSLSVDKDTAEIQGSSTVPFRPSDRILLVGEGDFSFSRALLTSYQCTSLLATSYDSRSVVIAKYPQAVSNIETLDAANQSGCYVLYEVDATKIGTSRVGSGGKRIKRGGFDRIVFNFPHVGGKTRDVARQVRYNQELLLGFFNAAVPLLAPMGTVIVTVFEGEPYQTWDLKGLAKDAGLKSRRSFRFQGYAYPGYTHARTLGNIEGGRGWKSEERPARTYLLELENGNDLGGKNGGRAYDGATGSNMQSITNKRNLKLKKRKRAETDSDSD